MGLGSEMAALTCCPGMKLTAMAATSLDHGIRIAPGTLATTTVRLFAAATAATIAFWFLAFPSHCPSIGVQPSSRDKEARSEPSDESVQLGLGFGFGLGLELGLRRKRSDEDDGVIGCLGQCDGGGEVGAVVV